MLAFGIDPGSRRTGWGAVRVEGSRLTCVDFGVIRVAESAPLSERLSNIFDGLSDHLARIEPERVFLESLFHHKSAKSALILGHARGVGMLAAARTGRPIGEVSPAEVKKAVTGSGRATKEQVQQMVKVLLGLEEAAPSDAADALAVAIAGASTAHWTDLKAALAPNDNKPKGRKRGWRR